MSYYVDRIMELYERGDIEGAVKLKEQCLKENLLTEKDKEDTRSVPDSISDLLTDEHFNPAKEKISSCAQTLYNALRNSGLSDQEIKEKCSLSTWDFDNVKGGRLKSRSIYNRVLRALYRVLKTPEK